MENFEYGEKVLVRDFDYQEWEPRNYINTVKFGDTGKEMYCVHLKGESSNFHSGLGTCWRQIRKIQPDLKSSKTLVTEIRKKIKELEDTLNRINNLQSKIK